MPARVVADDPEARGKPFHLRPPQFVRRPQRIRKEQRFSVRISVNAVVEATPGSYNLRHGYFFL
jgi:hypothetical protein